MEDALHLELILVCYLHYVIELLFSLFGSLPEVLQCVISSTHIVFLLTNGRICRYKYSVKTEASSGSASKFTSTAELEGRSSKSQKKDSDSWDAAPDNILPSMR